MSESKDLKQLLGQVVLSKSVLDKGMLTAPQKKTAEREFRTAVLDLLTGLVVREYAKTE